MDAEAQDIQAVTEAAVHLFFDGPACDRFAPTHTRFFHKLTEQANAALKASAIKRAQLGETPATRKAPRKH